ncbi:MAG: hypothetical protein U0838_11595 [Chloroflexota bacterium]
MRRIARALVAMVMVAACQATAPVPSADQIAPVAPGASSVASAAAPSFDLSGPFDPAALAAAVTSAGTDADREHAIMAALAALDIGVATPDGQPIVHGAERTASDFVVYDFEVTALGGAIADGDEVDLADIARELSVMNVTTGGAAFTADEFAQAVATATGEAMAHPERPDGYALRLARELGMRRSTPVDLSKLAVNDPILLDELSGFLVAADVSLPRILAAEPGAVETMRLASVDGLSGRVAAAGPCGAFSRKNGIWHAGMTSVPGAGGANASYSRSLQARLLGATVKIAGSWDKEWHHRHEGQPVKGQAYFVALQVRAPVPPRVNCGPIRFTSNSQMLGGGQITGAEVAWTHPNLEKHATFDCPDTCQRTNSEGVATLTFEAKKEPGPGGTGPTFTEIVPVVAEVDLFKALGPDLFGALSLPPDMRVFARKEMPTKVTWHRGYAFKVLVDSTLYVNKAQVNNFENHVGTAKALGVIHITTVHPAGDIAYFNPEVDTLVTDTEAGSGPDCASGTVTVEVPTATGKGSTKYSMPVTGSLKYKADQHVHLPFQAIEAVVDPEHEVSLYLDVGPGDAAAAGKATMVLCGKGRKVATTAKAANLWSSTIFQGHPRGLIFEGLTGTAASKTLYEGIWNLRASAADWRGTRDFIVAIWTSREACGGFCDKQKSELRLYLHAEPLPDP